MFEDRIETGRAATFIELRDDEFAIYSGCGLVIAEEHDGRLTGLTYASRMVDDEWTAAVLAAINNRPWQVGGRRYWLANASCYTLCDPMRLDDGDELERLNEAMNRLDDEIKSWGV